MYTYGNPCQSEKAGQKQQRNDPMSLTTLWDYDLFFVPSRRAGMEFCLARDALVCWTPRTSRQRKRASGLNHRPRNLSTVVNKFRGFESGFPLVLVISGSYVRC
jgi:hypothetical protein